MGLQNTPSMAAVPAHDVVKAHSLSSMSGTPSRRDHAAALEDSLLALTLRGDSCRDQEVSFNNSEADDMDYLQDVTDVEDGVYDDLDEDWEWETDECRLSKALRSWMTHYVITPLPPQDHIVEEPVFSARLGLETNIQRASSSESLDTQLSLFSCSSHGSQKRRERKRRRLRRKKMASAETQQKPQSAGQGSRWVELAKKRKGELDRFMMAQSHALAQGINLTDESEAFQLFEADEQRALYRCGQQDKLEFVAELKKSDSTTNIKADTRDKRKRRVASAGVKTFNGKPINFQELQRQILNQQLAELNVQRRASSRRSQHLTHSRLSLASISSGDQAFLSIPRHTPVSADTPSLLPAAVSPINVEASEPTQKEKSVNMWKGDAQILAIDLQRELTSKVKRRIAVTTKALERVTGQGDDNEQRPYSCHLPEFPAFVDEDFAHQPRIPQKIRIAPQLSDVIKSDIRVRMGRPRYHEIRVRDLEIWNRGQKLDRAHRNLKVFNWLHSLKEDEFDEASLQQTVSDAPPDVADTSFGDMVLIRAADEPEIKPLYEQKKYVR